MLDTIQFVEKVHRFYHDSFSDLLTLTLATMAFVGVVVPMIIQYVQSRSLATERESILNTLTAQLHAFEANIREELKTLLQSEIEKIRTELAEQIKQSQTVSQQGIDRSRGVAFHIQANDQLRLKSYSTATVSICDAINSYIAGKDEMNVQRAFTVLLSCLKALDSSAFDDNQALTGALSQTLHLVTENNLDYRYSNFLQDVDVATRNAKKRKPTA
jgi:hypothetical protein